jgi:hypothetical protein
MRIPLLSDVKDVATEVASSVTASLRTNATLAIITCPCGQIWSVLYPDNYLVQRVHVPECPGCGGSGKKFAVVTP